MKPTVPEKGTVIRLSSGMAEIILEGGHACKGCGAGKIGLCGVSKGSRIVHARNTVNAGAGDSVIIGIDQHVQIRGYLLAYLIPLFSFLAGAVMGHVLSLRFSLPGLDVAAAFSALALSATISFRRLRRLDETHTLTIKRVLRDAAPLMEGNCEEGRAYLRHAGGC